MHLNPKPKPQTQTLNSRHQHEINLQTPTKYRRPKSIQTSNEDHTRTTRGPHPNESTRQDQTNPNALSLGPLASAPNRSRHRVPSAPLPARMKQTFCSGVVSSPPRRICAELDFDSYVLYRCRSGEGCCDEDGDSEAAAVASESIFSVTRCQNVAFSGELAGQGTPFGFGGLGLVLLLLLVLMLVSASPS